MIDAWRKSDADAAHHAPHHGPSPAPESREPERSRARHMGSWARNKVAHARRVVRAASKSPAGLSRPRPQGRGHMSKVPRAEKR